MFSFKKKQSAADKEREKEEKERKKREKKERKKANLTAEELQRLQEAQRMYSEMATPYRGPVSGGSTSVTPSGSNDSMSSLGKNSPRELTPDLPSYTSYTKLELGKGGKAGPQTPPKPRGILKGKSNYGPEIPNQGVQGNLDDTIQLIENTIANEDLTAQLAEESMPKQSVKALARGFEVPVNGSGSHFQQQKHGSLTQRGAKIQLARGTAAQRGAASPAQPSQPDATVQDSKDSVDGSDSPTEKTFANVNLQLPVLAPPRCPKPREITLKRLPYGDFGFTLRKGTVLECDQGESREKKRMVIFAEPGSRSSSTGLLPGDRLLEVNEINVEKSSREDIITRIRSSGEVVSLKVQPIPELSELSLRSGLQGEEVEIQDRSVSTGTLQRSGSMRFKNTKQAKTDAQIASEQAWLSAERVWLIHKGGFAAARVQRGDDADTDAKVTVKLDHGGEVLEVEEEDVEKANPPQFDRVEDLATLRYLNESSVLHTLRQRYGSNLIHSYAGHSMVIVNPMHPLSIYSDKVIQMFRGCKPEDMPPHIYATAQLAYRNMLSTRKDQSIVLMGRSGSGKSTNLKHLLHFFTIAAGSSNNVMNMTKLPALFLVLDAFGNSRTIMNTNATRFTHITTLDFDHTGQIAGASLQVMLLERARVARRPEGEPTFHVFYQMLVGIDSALRKDLLLENLNEPNIFMTPVQRSEDRQRAMQSWAETQNAMKKLGLTPTEIKAILSILAAIYHLGVAGVSKASNNKYHFARPAAAQKAASVLGCSLEELSKAVFTGSSPVIQNRGNSLRPGAEMSPTVATENLTGLECLESFAIGLYSEAFSALISLINRSLASNARTLCSISILDAPGFQNPGSVGRAGGASLEDLCHNYFQERLQLMFHQKVFTAEQDLYAQENIECDFDMVITSSARMVALIDQPSPQSLVRSPGRDKHDQEYMGLLWLLDEECLSQTPSEETLIQRLVKLNPESGHKRDALIRDATSSMFTLNHFQGTNPVTYNTKGWMKISRETAITRGVNSFLQDSHKEEISTLFLSIRGTTSTMTGSIVGMEGTSSLRRTASMRRNFTSASASVKRKSLCLQVKFQVDTIMETLRRSKPHFVHCILPQHNAGLCDLKEASMGPPSKPGTASIPSTENIMMNVPVVRSQLRGGEVIEAIRIYRQGFPEHIPFAEFRKKFEVLLPADSKIGQPGSDEKQAAEELLQHLDIDPNTYRLGLSQVFFRSGGLAQLDDAREEKISGFITRLQAQCRGFLGRKKLKKLQVQNKAVICLQRNIRLFRDIRGWPWWRLYVKVKPLLNVHRTEEELKDRELELELLKAKLLKAEKERAEYKQSLERSENKLSEISADLADEHTASNQAGELLERETSDRLRLEKELKELSSKHTALQRRHEQTEMDLMHTRMLAAELDAELDEDETDGNEAMYRQRYERSRREAEMAKQQLMREHQEEVERLETSRKHTDRKLTEALDDSEEQRRQLTSSKRKAQRLQQELADSKLHLEEALARNNDLEKKQRKFDSELHKSGDLQKEERMLREKLQREKEQLAADKYSIEQTLKNVQLDYELQQDKVTRLERELQDLTTVEKDDRELLVLKRAKNELERSVQDQQEELDEQAGSIQQLEQNKLRLEMQQERMRQQHARELEEREQDLEDLRASNQKKVRNLEAQLEEDYAEKQSLVKEKRELERKLQEMAESVPARDIAVEKRLKRELRHTRTLLQDAQTVLNKQKDGSASKALIRQLKNQLEDAEYAAAAAVKARKGTEMEVQDLQQQLDDLAKSKQEVEERSIQLGREKTDLQTEMEDNDEDTSELMRKYRAAVQQNSMDTQTILDQSRQIEELQRDKDRLREELSSLNTQIDHLMSSRVEKEGVVRLEAKIRELELKVDYESTAKQRAETQLARAKEQVEKHTDSISLASAESQKQQEVTKRYQRQLRDTQEELSDLQRKETDSSQRKHDLEQKIETLEGEVEQGQADLRLAFKRISDLQSALEEDAGDDSDEFDGSDYLDETDTDSEDESPLANMRNRSYALATRLNSVGSSVHSADYDLPLSSSSTRNSRREVAVNGGGDCAVNENIKQATSSSYSTPDYNEHSQDDRTPALPTTRIKRSLLHTDGVFV